MKGVPIMAANSWLLFALIAVLIITNYMLPFTWSSGKYFTTAKFQLASPLSLFFHQEDPKVEILQKLNSAWYNHMREPKNSHNANSWKFLLVHNVKSIRPAHWSCEYMLLKYKSACVKTTWKCKDIISIAMNCKPIIISICSGGKKSQAFLFLTINMRYKPFNSNMSPVMYNWKEKERGRLRIIVQGSTPAKSSSLLRQSVSHYTHTQNAQQINKGCLTPNMSRRWNTDKSWKIYREKGKRPVFL